MRSLCLVAGSTAVLYGSADYFALENSNTVTPERPTRTFQLLAYLGIVLCAFMLVIGALAAIFEDAPVVRVYGALASLMAVIVGHTIARRIWPKKPVAEGMN